MWPPLCGTTSSFALVFLGLCLLVEDWKIKEHYNMEDGAYLHFVVYLERKKP
jgi:hypothetical protein